MINTIFLDRAIALRVAKGFAVVALSLVTPTGYISLALGMIMVLAGAYGVLINIFEAIAQTAINIAEFLGLPMFDAFESKSDKSWAWEEIGGSFAVGVLMATVGGGVCRVTYIFWVMLLPDTETETENFNGWNKID